MQTVFARKILVLGTNQTGGLVVQWLITAIKAVHFVWRYHELIIVIILLKELLTPFLIPFRTFYIWAPHGSKFLRVNPP